MTSILSNGLMIKEDSPTMPHSGHLSRKTIIKKYQSKREILIYDGGEADDNDTRESSSKKYGPPPQTNYGTKTMKVYVPSASPDNSKPSEIVLEMEVDPSTQILDFLVRLCSLYRLHPPSDYCIWAPTGVSRALEPCKASARINSLYYDAGPEAQTPVDYIKVVMRRKPSLPDPLGERCDVTDSHYGVSRLVTPTLRYRSAGMETPPQCDPTPKCVPFELTQRVLVSILPLGCHKKCVVRASLDEPIDLILQRVCTELILDPSACHLVNPGCCQRDLEGHTGAVPSLQTLDPTSTMRVQGLSSEIYLLPPSSYSLPARFSTQTLPHRYPSDTLPSISGPIGIYSTTERYSHPKGGSPHVVDEKYERHLEIYDSPVTGKISNGSLTLRNGQKPKVTEIGSFRKAFTLMNRSSVTSLRSTASPTRAHYPDERVRVGDSSSSSSPSPSLSSSTTAGAAIFPAGRNRRRRAPLPPPPSPAAVTDSRSRAQPKAVSQTMTELGGTIPTNFVDHREGVGGEVGVRDRRSVDCSEVDHPRQDTEDDVHSYSSGYHGSSMSPSPAGFEKNVNTCQEKNSLVRDIPTSNEAVLLKTKKKGAAPKPPSPPLSQHEQNRGGVDSPKISPITKLTGSGRSGDELIDDDISYAKVGGTGDGVDNDTSDPDDHYDSIEGYGESERYRDVEAEQLGYQPKGDRSFDYGPSNLGDDKALGYMTEKRESPENFYENVKDEENEYETEDYEKCLRGPGQLEESPVRQHFNDFDYLGHDSSFVTDTSSAIYSEVRRSSTREFSGNLDVSSASCFDLTGDFCASSTPSIPDDIPDRRLPVPDGDVACPPPPPLPHDFNNADVSPPESPAQQHFEIPKSADAKKNGTGQMSDEETRTIDRGDPKNLPQNVEHAKYQTTPCPVNKSSTDPSRSLSERTKDGVDDVKRDDKGIKKRVSFFKLRTSDVSEIVKRARNIPLSESDENSRDPKPFKAPTKIRTLAQESNGKENLSMLDGAKVSSTLRDPSNERPWTLTTLFRSSPKSHKPDIIDVSHSPKSNELSNYNSVPPGEGKKTSIDYGSSQEVLHSSPCPKPEASTTNNVLGRRNISNNKRPEGNGSDVISLETVSTTPYDLSSTYAPSGKSIDTAAKDRETPKSQTKIDKYDGPVAPHFIKSPAFKSSLYSKFNSILSTLSLSSSSSSSMASSSSTISSLDRDRNSALSKDSHPPPLPFSNHISSEDSKQLETTPEARDQLLLQIRTCGGTNCLKKKCTAHVTTTVYQSL